MDKKKSVLIGSVALAFCIFAIAVLAYNVHTLSEKEDKDNNYNNNIRARASYATMQPYKVSDNRNSDSPEKITGDTRYFLQTYYVNADNHDNLTEKEYNVPSRFITYDKEKMQEYIDGYMENMPLSEYLDGLISYEIIDFSKNTVVLRKTYASDWNEHQYYICDVNGEVVVYYSDKSTVYEYTGIRTDSLSEDEQVRIRIGYFVSDEEELYSLLESYSS